MEVTDLGDLYARRPDLYDLMHADLKDDARFIGEYARLLGEAPRVLELGCGTGRLLQPLLEAGATVVGIDREPAMLEVARRRLTAFAERLSLVQSEMRRFHLDEQFDLVLVGLNTFMHLLTHKQQITCLETIHRHLRPAGVLLLDLACPHTVVREAPAAVVQHRFTKTMPDNPRAITTLWSSTQIAPATQLTHTTLFFDEIDGETGAVRRTVAEVILRLIYRYELELLLTRAGFVVRNLYGDYDSGPYDDESERLICVAAALA